MPVLSASVPAQIMDWAFGPFALIPQMKQKVERDKK